MTLLCDVWCRKHNLDGWPRPTKSVNDFARGKRAKSGSRLTSMQSDMDASLLAAFTPRRPLALRSASAGSLRTHANPGCKTLQVCSPEDCIIPPVVQVQGEGQACMHACLCILTCPCTPAHCWCEICAFSSERCISQCLQLRWLHIPLPVTLD